MTNKPSRYLQEVRLGFSSNNKEQRCNCEDDYFLETDVGPNGEDTCQGDSGQVIYFDNGFEFSVLFQEVHWF